MGISELPASTIRQIGSTQCLTDPASVVKELVENSLDAGATAIFVEVSSNTIGKIIVKDNGHGIALEDRSVVCKRYHTSKIRNLGDLHDLGGQTLGFRGEALASAADMSAKLVLITRCEGEPNAVEIKYDRAGLIESEKPTFHSVGTTVEVHDFLSNLPVRRQSAEKNSTKILSKTKKLLQAYALARPWIRLSFKVLKAKNEKGDWSFSPRGGARSSAVFKSSTLDAAITVFGRKAAEQLQCYSFTWSSTGEFVKIGEGGSPGPEVEGKDEYNIKLLLVSSSIRDTACINNLGTHISIDTRPVSCNRGILKDINRHYKSCLKSAISGNEVRKIIDPLSIINISCPNGGYDINVDPAKDDILFTDAKIVLQVCQKSLDSVYGKPENIVEQCSISKITPDKGNFNVLLATRTIDRTSSAANDTLQPAETASLEPGHHSESSQSARATKTILGGEQPPDGPFTNPTTEDTTASLDDQDEVNFLAGKECNRKAFARTLDQINTGNRKIWPNSTQSESESTSEEDDLCDVKVSNPWTLAKIHTPLRRSIGGNTNRNSDRAAGHLPNPQCHRGDVTGGHTESLCSPLTSPNSSPIPFPYPIKAFSKRQSENPYIETSKSISMDDEYTALDSWLQKSRRNTIDGSKVHGYNSMFEGGDQPPLKLTAARSSHIQGTALRDIPNVSQRPRQKAVPRTRTNEQSQTSPISSPERVWFEVGEQSHPHRSQKGRFTNKPRRNSINLRSEESDPKIITAIMHPDLAVSLEYETRKAKATQDHREHLRREKAAVLAQQHASTAQQRTLDSLLRPCAPQGNQNSPHKNRQRKAVALLHAHANSPPAEAENTTYLHPGIKTPPSKRPPKRQPLLLERIAEQDWVSDLVLPLSTTHAGIAEQMQKAANWDDYVHSGEYPAGLDKPETRLFAIWEGRVRHLVGRLYQKGDPHVEDGRIFDAGDLAFAPFPVFCDVEI